MSSINAGGTKSNISYTSIKHRWRRVLALIPASRLSRSFASAQRLACARLQGAVGSLPFTRARRRVCDLSHQPRQRLCALLLQGELRQYFIVLRRIDKRRFAVLADSDTGLRTFDASATYALPCCNALSHGLASRGRFDIRPIHRVDGDERMRICGTGPHLSGNPDRLHDLLFGRALV